MNRHNNLQDMKKELNRKYEKKEITIEEYVEELPILHNKMIEASYYMKDYLKISEQFPHLTLKEIIDFEEKLKENGGVLKTHSGKFMFDVRKDGMCRGYHGKFAETVYYVAWDCCSNAQNIGNETGSKNRYYPRDSTGFKMKYTIASNLHLEHKKVKRLEELNVCDECKERGFKGVVKGVSVNYANTCTHVPLLNLHYPVNSNRSSKSGPEVFDAVHLKNPNPITNFCDFPMNFSLN
jgi:hypothetical protein